MPNCESNRNGWKDGNSKCNCYDKKEDPCYSKKEEPCYCESKDNKHENNKKETCCCKDSMKKSLELLTCPTVNPYVNFNQFGFIGKHLLAGAQLTAAITDGDNISVPDATFSGFESCSCSSLRLTPTTEVFYPVPGSASLALNINHASLCNIQAVAFTYNTTAITRSEFEANLIALLDDSHEKCSIKCEDCCCNEGVFNSIFNSFSSNIVSLTGGWLALQNVKVLGRVGNVLVLSNTTTTVNMIYFVCLDSIEFLNY
ncbi:CotA family spore coat protein [Romboutsia sedimentorum]|uniref:CotA family spore coat protein n=1 Tax=Romboutsia sedimentorum TaxID=1368474 RepID=A0ABT7EAU8_9FIRM|nr:CotA family spore coat protein [Romboutsia sedimentorum]MDK2564054.1 CotA family spore coat protein [Romboutsia sedimentorum]MDK2587333.1 CotA family spore coat protein [Romboutsia sedimentorum]